MLIKRNCITCHIEFIAKRRDNLFCCKPCAQKYIDYRRRVLDAPAATAETLELYKKHVAEQAALLEEATAKAA